MHIKNRAVFSILVIMILNCTPASSVHFNTANKHIADIARSYLGVPYQYGGISRSGMDCSGLVCRVYRDWDKRVLPHSVKALFRMGKPVMLSQIIAGDCLFFAEPGQKTPTHMGIALGGHQFIHASQKRGVVTSGLKQPYFKKRLRGIRRL